MKLDIITLHEANAYTDSVAGAVGISALQVSSSENSRRITEAEKAIAMANPNGEARVSISDYDTSITLPKNAAIGGLGAAINGNTLMQEITNGFNIASTTGWAVGSAYVQAINAELELYGANTATPNIKWNLSKKNKNGDKIYLRAVARGNANTTSIELRYRDADASLTVVAKTATTGLTANQTISGIATLTADSNAGGLQLLFNHVSTPVNSSFVNMAMQINLTSLGLDSLTAAQCDTMTDLYFAGLKHNTVTRLRSVSADSAQTSAVYIEPREHRRLPNGVCDTTSFPSGRYTQNVKKYTLTASDVIGATVGTNTTVFSVLLPSDSVNSALAIMPTPIYIETIPWGYAASADFDNVAMIGKWGGLSSADRYIGVVFALGTTLAQCKTALAGTVIYYQLAAPVYAENTTIGTLTSYPGGTVYAENAIADAGMYNNGISILRTGYPIASLESIKKINADGTETSLDVSAATIAHDGLSFTHTGLASNDIVFFTYFYTYTGVRGYNTFSYLDSKFVVADTADDDKYYTWKPVITNGAIASWTVTEVT